MRFKSRPLNLADIPMFTGDEIIPRIEYAFLPYVIFAQRTTTQKEASDMKTLSEIADEFKNATPEEQEKNLHFLLKDPEIYQYFKVNFLKFIRPANFEIFKRMQEGYV